MINKLFRIILIIGALSILAGFSQWSRASSASASIPEWCELICPSDPCEQYIHCYGLCDASHTYCGQACFQDIDGNWRAPTSCDVYYSGVQCISCL